MLLGTVSFMTMILPEGNALLQLTQDSPKQLLEDVRAFCLRMIKVTYGYDYRQDWHNDLDSILDPANSFYFDGKKGAFFVIKAPDGSIIGSSGLRALTSRPDLMERFKEYFPASEQVGSHWRMYIDPVHRKKGMGKLLMAVRELQARRNGFTCIYHHCNKDAPRLRAYWEAHGYKLIGEDEMSAHYLLQL